MTHRSFVQIQPVYRRVRREELSQRDILQHAPAPSQRQQPLLQRLHGIHRRVDIQSPRPQRGGHLRHLGHVQPHLLQLVGAGEHLLRRALHQHPPVGQHGDPLHVPGDLLHAVAHQHHRRALGAVIGLYLGENGVPPLGIKSRRGLVQHQHLRLHGDHAGDSHPALLPPDSSRATCPAAPRPAPQRPPRPHAGRSLSVPCSSSGDVVHRLSNGYSGYWNTSPALNHASHIFFGSTHISFPSSRIAAPEVGWPLMLYQRGLAGPCVR